MKLDAALAKDDFLEESFSDLAGDAGDWKGDFSDEYFFELFGIEVEEGLSSGNH